jgi:hypothetical protein
MKNNNRIGSVAFLVMAIGFYSQQVAFGDDKATAVRPPEQRPGTNSSVTDKSPRPQPVHIVEYYDTAQTKIKAEGYQTAAGKKIPNTWKYYDENGNLIREE